MVTIEEYPTTIVFCSNAVSYYPDSLVVLCGDRPRHPLAAEQHECHQRKDEVAKQIAQIVEDRAFATRPTYQIPPSWKATHITRPQAFYKVVACRDDKFVSVVDGDTEFALGKTYKTRRGTPSGWAPMSECFLAWNSPLGALNAAFPEGSKATGLPRVLLKIEGRGNAYEEHEVFRGGHSRWTEQISLGAMKVCRIMTDAFRNTSADKVLLPDFHIPQKFPPLMPSWDL